MQIRIIDDIYKTPVKVNDAGRAEFEDIAFVNTSYLTETARHFHRFGCYTKAHPVYDKKEFKEFWDLEEQKRLNGVTLPGKLIYEKGKGYSMQQVHITGEHYGYLNFAPITRTTNVKDGSEAHKNVTHSRKVGSKSQAMPDFWDGDYYYFHARKLAKEIGKHMTVAKARRKGYSFKNAWCAANTYDLIPFRTTLIGAYDKKYLTIGDGTMVMVKNYLDHLNLTTDWKKGRLKDTSEFYKSGYKLQGEQEERGFKSSIIAVSFMDNADAAIGKDAEEMFFEEAGKFPNLIEALDVTLPTLEDGDLITGLITIFGTGGTKGANWFDFEKIFYNPDLFNMLVFENVWDRNARGTSCCFFHPHILNLIPYIDENGNSQKEKALTEFNKRKEEQKEKAETPADYVIWCGQRANSPEEAFTKSESNYFYTPELDEWYKKVKHSLELKKSYRMGEINVLGDNYKLFETDKHPPVTDYPLREEKDLNGCYVEWLTPYRNSEGKIPDGLYRIWHDPYGVDKDDEKINLRDSLGCAYIYEMPNNFTPTRGDVIIGAYIGRPGKMDDYNENLFKIAEYVNGMIMFENDRGEVYPYAKRINAVNRLVEEPEILWKKEISGRSGRNYGVSIGNNAQRKPIGAKGYKDWLYTQRGVDKDGNPIFNFHYIYDVGLLSETLSWNLKGNFDRVSAMIVGMYDLKEILYATEAELKRGVDTVQDDFFNRELFV